MDTLLRMGVNLRKVPYGLLEWRFSSKILHIVSLAVIIEQVPVGRGSAYGADAVDEQRVWSF